MPPRRGGVVGRGAARRICLALEEQEGDLRRGKRGDETTREALSSGRRVDGVEGGGSSTAGVRDCRAGARPAIEGDIVPPTSAPTKGGRAPRCLLGRAEDDGVPRRSALAGSDGSVERTAAFCHGTSGELVGEGTRPRRTDVRLSARAGTVGGLREAAARLVGTANSILPPLRLFCTRAPDVVPLPLPPLPGMASSFGARREDVLCRRGDDEATGAAEQGGATSARFPISLAADVGGDGIELG
ncbi:hypothetical protein THAOC_12938 [Thalassiosira oceanica]|uniref:Uncharacterized protein n=1 Tax=Thalassiosira oceanica TaxID=159749 RepID=K0T6W5_THAOC|nr:hypothetical protein THAOC_12938 [Thalassiosira oceanica]|eukprot:EJK66157.1 hypothetical protein THAOC_12938 [Thalassiosira oceanica]